MATLPIRGLGAGGLVCDQDGAGLDPGVLTTARNVRFTGAQITTGPAFRVYHPAASLTSPVFSYTLTAPGEFDRVLVADFTGLLRTATPGAEADVTPDAWASAPSSSPWTAASLAGLHYISRADRPPVKFSGGSTFVPLDHWDPTWSCAALRSYGDCLVALATIENGISYPGRIRWSEFAQAGAEPVSWDAADPTVNSGFNYLAELKTPILDGLSLGQDFFVYSSDAVWRMRLVGGRDVMAFAAAFKDFGLVNANCVTEVESQHICFSQDDIIAHDGVNKKSLVEGRIRRRLFNSIDWDAQQKMFVLHDRANHEVWFCYRSTGDDVTWPQGDYCTEAAVWQYATDTWVFRDLPNVGVGCVANASSSATWDSLLGTPWDQLTRSWGAGESAGQRAPVWPAIPCLVQPSAALLIADGYGRDNHVNLPLYTTFQPDIKLGRDRLNVDSIGGDLTTYQRVNRVLPIAVTEGSRLYGLVGGALYPNQPIVLSPEKTLDPATGYKMDVLRGGRYLSWQLRATGDGYFSLSGLNLVIAPKGRR